MAIPKKVRAFFQYILFTGVGVLILILVYRSQNAAYIADCALKGIPDSECSLFEKLKSDFASVNYWWILAIVLAFIMSNVLRAHRWLLLIKTLGTNGKFQMLSLPLWLAILQTWAFQGVGEVVRAGLFAKYEK
ncbi:MAG: hypothetical protein IPL92_02600 [Saprospiraceae bacterium]|nr:hypothetical protein [Candidatus Opimibacter iunctus]